jgi:phage shock protein PspC (stress-responsive transcriptional regulator)
MKKTLTITLNGIAFNIEEDAYNKLKAYLDSIRDYFSAHEGNQEILNDIEARAAEKFSEKVSGAKQAVNLDDVEELIKSMGTVEDIAGVEKTAPENENKKEEKKSWRGKKLYRDPDNAVILGIAAGIANYLGIDPVFVRLAFIVSLFFGGMGILIYIILFFIVPEAKTTSQKFEMHGQSINLSSLKEAAEEKIATAKENISSARPIRKTIVALTPIVKKIWRLLLVLFGSLIIAGTVAAMIGIFFVFGNLFFNASSPFVNFPEKEFFSGLEYLFFIGAGFFIAFIPVLCGMFLGLSLIRRKLMIRLSVGLAILMIWIISITTVGIFGTRLFSRHQEKMRSAETSEKITRSFDFRDFNSVELSSMHEARIVKGDEFKIEARGSENDLKNLKINQNGKTLEIDNYHEGICIFCDSWQTAEITITMPELVRYKADRTAKATVSGFGGEKIDFNLDGASGAEADIQMKNVSIELDGISKLSLKGSADELEAKIDGASNLNAVDFKVKRVSVDSDGSSVSRVWATEKLNAKGDAAGKIFYKGEPKIEKDMSAASRLKKID